MKLNHRDRVLITIVFVVAVWVIGVWFFIVPAFQDLGDRKDDLNNLQVELSGLNDKIERDKDLPQRIEAEYARSEELAKNFYTRSTTQDATDTVDKLLDEQMITNSTMKINEYSLKTLKPFYYVPKIVSTDIDNKADQYEKVGSSSAKSSDSTAAAATTESTSPSGENSVTDEDTGAVLTIDPNIGVGIGHYAIELEFTGKYGDVQKFCEELTKNVPGSMVLSGLDIKNVNGIEKEGEEGKDNSDSSSSSQAPESKKEDDKKDDKDALDDNEIEGTITIELMVIQKLTKPEF